MHYLELAYCHVFNTYGHVHTVIEGELELASETHPSRQLWTTMTGTLTCLGRHHFH